MRSVNSTYLTGAVSGFAAVSIWAGWSVMTRLAITTDLDAWDVAALRSGVAGLLLFPVIARRGLAIDRLGWLGLAVIVTGQGAPYVLVAASGLQFASAYDQGALNPGCMPLFVALIATVVLGEKLSATQKAGLSLIFAGALLIVVWHPGSTAWNLARAFGDGLFLVASFLTACFTVKMRQARLEPIHLAAIVATGSLVIYLPGYIALRGTHLVQLALTEIAVQAVFQGVMVTIVALLLYCRAVAILGASGGAAFGGLVPALSALLAIPLLGKSSTETGWAAIVLISSGVYLASGGALRAATSSSLAR